jgi:hypothetical protein
MGSLKCQNHDLRLPVDSLTRPGTKTRSGDWRAMATKLIASRPADTFDRINEFDCPADVLQCFVVRSYSKVLHMESLDVFELCKLGVFGPVRISARSNLPFSPIPPERQRAPELARGATLLAVRQVLRNIFP